MPDGYKVMKIEPVRVLIYALQRKLEKQRDV